MNFFADESLDRQIVTRLRQDGHVVLDVTEMYPGISDDKVLSMANESIYKSTMIRCTFFPSLFPLFRIRFSSEFRIPNSAFKLPQSAAGACLSP